MRYLIFVLIGTLMLSGCFGWFQTQEAGPPVLVDEQAPLEQEPAQQSPGQDPAPPATGEGTIVDAAQPKAGIAYDQQDCATLSPDCASCVAKENCGWCKRDTAGCFYGDELGPIGTATCAQENWAYALSACQGPAGGGSCASKTNCADCLSGSGCKWCIQGSVCSDSADTSDCFGGWKDQIFQCNYASR